MKTFGLLSTMVAALALTSMALGQRQKTQVNQTKGQGQLTGGYIKFGEIYSLRNGLNFQILKAYYSIDPFPSYAHLAATNEMKFLVIEFAVKNATHDDNDSVDQENQISVFDSNGNKYDAYSGMTALASNGAESFFRTLKPGQGLGQPSLNDPLRVAFQVPLKAKITKIVLNQPRLNKNEEVVRYLLAGTDKEADPANVIGGLPKNVADPSDGSGAIALPEGKAKLGESFVSYFNSYIAKSVDITKDPIVDGNAPDDGKSYAVITLTMKNVNKTKAGIFDCLDTDDVWLKDSDGEKYTLAAILKAKTNDRVELSGDMDPGDERTVRYVFQVPEKASLRTMKFCASGSAYPWLIDLTSKIGK